MHILFNFVRVEILLKLTIMRSVSRKILWTISKKQLKYVYTTVAYYKINNLQCKNEVPPLLVLLKVGPVEETGVLQAPLPTQQV